MKNILFVFGTRPEAIKMAPLIKEFQKNNHLFNPIVCLTAQHRQMLDQVCSFFSINADFDLDLMKKDQTLFDITANGLRALDSIIAISKPDIVFVQGDTTSAFIGALAGYYYRIPVAHLEAGLRSGKKYSPFPEEINRKLVGHMADYHFAPTQNAAINLSNEGISSNVWVVGNTVIDALFLCLGLLKKRDSEFRSEFPEIDTSKRIILVTGHRRESFGKPFENICEAIAQIATARPDIQIIYPVHLNPNVQEPVNRILKKISNIQLIEPLDYPQLVWLMKQSFIVLTDSGGIQEEAPSLGKPVLVMRDVTERTEGVTAGTANLVGTSKEAIVANTIELLDSKKLYTAMSNAINPYGDGTASKKIVAKFIEFFYAS